MSHTFRNLFGMCDGDDGARTRDLCRDRIPKKRNLLKQRVADGSNSAIRKPWEGLLLPYRTHVLCRFVLCRQELASFHPDFGRGRVLDHDLSSSASPLGPP